MQTAEERLQALEDGTADLQGPTEEMELEEILGDGPTEAKLKQELEESKRSSEKAQHMFSTSQAQLKMYMDQCAQLRLMLDAKTRGQDVPKPEEMKAETSPVLPRTPIPPNKRVEAGGTDEQDRKKFKPDGNKVELFH